MFPRTLALSRDGTQAAFESFGGGLFILDLKRGTTRRLVDSNGLGVRWSADGQRVAFSNFGLYQRRANGVGEAELLLKSDGVSYPLDWSPDGRFLLYREDNPTTRADWWALSLEDKKRFPIVQTRANETDARFSPDGRWIAYVSDETGRSDVLLRRFVPGTATTGGQTEGSQPVTRGGVATLLGWSADGKQLWYAGAYGKVMSMDVTLAPSIEAGEPKPLFAMPSDSFAFASDGNRLLVAVPTPHSTRVPIKVVLNWPALLRR